MVYCGSPDAEFNYMEGFAFLNESRKKQFIALMKEADVLPVYCEGDDEICLRAGIVSDGRILASICKIGIDPLDSVKLYLSKKTERISMLTAKGEEKQLEFEKIAENLYEIKQKAETMRPLVLLIG